MERFIKGDVVVIPFPFSDLSSFKKRPALIITPLKGEDIILCQITSKNVCDNEAIKLIDSDIIEGRLKRDSNIRPNKIFTADQKIILYKVGKLKDSKLEETIESIINIVKG